MRIIRIDHISLDVHDRSASIDWYEEVLGMRAARRRAKPDEPIFLGPTGARLGLFEERAPGLRHIALATDAAGQHSVIVRLESLAIPYRRERHIDSDSIYFSDREGTTLELMVPRT